MNGLFAVAAAWAGISALFAVGWVLAHRAGPRRPTGAWWCTTCGASGVDTPRICRCTRETERTRS